MPGRSRSASQVARVLIARPLSIDTLLDFLRVSSLFYIFGLFSVSYSPLLFFSPAKNSRTSSKFQVPWRATFLICTLSRQRVLLFWAIESFLSPFLFYFSFLFSPAFINAPPACLSSFFRRKHTRAPNPPFLSLWFCVISPRPSWSGMRTVVGLLFFHFPFTETFLFRFRFKKQK